MKIKILRHHWPELLLGLLTLSYIIYFSLFSILRYKTLYAHYFDLGIMHQTVYNTFISLKTGDWSRFLELTNPHGFDQVKRMAVHNDMFLALFAPFYFIYSGPETLLILQTIAVGLGTLAVYGIGIHIFEKTKYPRQLSVLFAFAYLMYPALQRANQFDFHAVVFATPLLLFMFYFYLKKRYSLSFMCAFASLFTKEQVGLTLAFFGLFILAQNVKLKIARKKHNKREYLFAFLLILMGVGWFYISMTQIIPHFRSGAHFALSYFGDFGDSTTTVFIGLLKNPIQLLQHIFRKETYEYLYNILGPFGFLSFFSPLHLLIAAPEFGINLLSKSEAMRNIYYHYTAVITPFVVVSAMYGFTFLASFIQRSKRYVWVLPLFLMVTILFFSVTLSPLPYAQKKEVHPFIWPAKERFDAFEWREQLSDDSLKVMATGHLAPLFSSRRYFYYYSERYDLADYIVLSVDEAYNSYGSTNGEEIYLKIQTDKRFVSIYDNGSFEVYKKIE